ncbi:MAG: dTDP-glucose 4,6-dehydratase [Desulfobacterales bacterium]|jgi:dTDP-glucose 4,6-dehydratase
MENIMVTGGCGFIGTNFIYYMLSNAEFNGRIINVDKLTYAGNPDNLVAAEKTYAKRYIFQKADICDARAMAALFDRYAVDTICNFAAESHVDRSIVEPDAFIKTNIEGTFRLLELARQYIHQLKLFHHVSTDEVYGSLGMSGYFTEKTPYRPNSPYSASKASSDHLVRAYYKTYGLPVTISNCSNNYGPYQFPEKMIPLMILNALENKPLPVYGEGRNVRDWLYVTDHCQAIWKIMQAGTRGEMYNIGGQCEMANIDLVGRICDLLDDMVPRANSSPRRDLITFVKDRPGHDLRYAIDFSKLTDELGWLPQETFESGIRKTIEWYLDHQAWVDQIKNGAYYQRWMKQQYGKE